MKFDTQTAAQYAGEKLSLLLERVERDTAEAIAQSDIPDAVTYFAELRDMVDELKAKTSALQKHVEHLSYELIPTMFTNQNIKSIKVPSIGRVTVNVKWSASMLDKTKAFEWLRSNGSEGLIIETVNASTLGAFAKERTFSGKPLPSDIFATNTLNYTSITKG